MLPVKMCEKCGKYPTFPFELPDGTTKESSCCQPCTLETLASFVDPKEEEVISDEERRAGIQLAADFRDEAERIRRILDDES